MRLIIGLLSMAVALMAQSSVSVERIGPTGWIQDGLVPVKIGTSLSTVIPVQLSASSTAWSCSLDNIGAALTQCRAAPAAGQKLYITDIIAQSTTAASGLMLLRYGTGTDCATGTASIFPASATVARFAYPANTSMPFAVHFSTPLAVPTAANALCALGTATNTLTITIMGYTAP